MMMRKTTMTMMMQMQIRILEDKETLELRTSRLMSFVKHFVFIVFEIEKGK